MMPRRSASGRAPLRRMARGIASGLAAIHRRLLPIAPMFDDGNGLGETLSSNAARGGARNAMRRRDDPEAAGGGTAIAGRED